MTIPLKMRFDVLERDRFKCRYCGKRSVETELEVDHIRPRAKGGSDDLVNLATVCRDCNQAKSDRIIEPPGVWDSLVGKFFHTFCTGQRIKRQGRVIAQPGPDHFVIEYLDWITGRRSFAGTRVVSIAQIEAEQWAFYADDASMRDSFENSGLQHWPELPCVCRDEIGP